ncbi:hypothetical protein CVT24_012465, partial [Panaeolus cyanescens]
FRDITNTTPTTSTPLKANKTSKRKKTSVDENTIPLGESSQSKFRLGSAKKVKAHHNNSNTSLPPVPQFPYSPSPSSFTHAFHSIPNSNPIKSPPLTVDQKLQRMIQALKSCHWTLGEFLFHMSNHVSRGGREHNQAQMMSSFLSGRTSHTPMQIISLWIKSPDSRVSAGAGKSESDLMYNLDVPYHLIQSLRPAITSYAAQTIEKRVIFEAQKAVGATAGLHASLRKSAHCKVEMIDIGASTMSEIGSVQIDHQPLTCRLLESIGGRARNPVRTTRVRKGDLRPVELVRINTLSSLNFARNREARLLPLLKGLLYFAHSAPADLFAYNSRLGEMPSYSTIYQVARQLGINQAATSFQRGRNPAIIGALQLDNVQNYIKPQDHRMGRVAQMNIGIAGVYYELNGVQADALDVSDRQMRVAQNKRASLTVATLLSWIDGTHLDIIYASHWLRILINYIPELASMKVDVNERFRTKGAKLRLEPDPTTVHSLSTSGKNETYTSEIKDGLVDFLSQIGQKDGDYLNRLILVGGDGLTFQKLNEVKRYLQFHSDPLQSMELVQPVLALWHTEWTNLSRIYETHQGSSTSRDPSCIGHSACQIGQSLPPNVKKVDYHTGSELLNVVVTSRILDCWRIRFNCEDLRAHFRNLAEKKQLPTFQELESHADALHSAYSTTQAIYEALGDTATSNTKWSRTVPLGTPWPETPHPVDPSKPLVPKPTKSAKSAPKIPAAQRRDSKGDRSLSNSIALIRDGLLSMEFSFASAEGDVGRVYELLKILLFTFAGSTHSKYTTYLLEFLTQLELESSRSLKEAILWSTLVNLRGRAGSFTASDLMQEYFNRLLEAVVDKKGSKYDDEFIRTVIAPNLHHFARIKIEMRNSVGLNNRSGRHSAPGIESEIATLLRVYRKCELHKRRPGRVYNDKHNDDFNAGVIKLDNGRLQRWVWETSRARELIRKSERVDAEVTSQQLAEDHGDEACDDTDEEEQEEYLDCHRLDSEVPLFLSELDDSGNCLYRMSMLVDSEEIESGNDSEDFQADENIYIQDLIDADT